MTNERLDDLLAQARDPEPADDGFTDGVMGRVRGTSKGWRRYVTRPALIAIAAVLVGGGALAGMRVAQTDKPVEAEAPTASLVVGPGVRSGEERPVATDRAPRPTPTTKPEPSERPMPTPITRDGATYGYETRHTSYAEHQGVRLTLETGDNEATVGEPKRVRLTLRNVGDDPVVITADGCPTTVHVRSADGASESAARNCFEGEQTKDEPTKIVLRPGDEHSTTSVIGFGEAGEWQVVGMCRCTAHRFDDRTTTDSTDDSTSQRVGPTSDTTAAQITEPSRTATPTKSPPPSRNGPTALRLVTPPITIIAS